MNDAPTTVSTEPLLHGAAPSPTCTCRQPMATQLKTDESSQQNTSAPLKGIRAPLKDEGTISQKELVLSLLSHSK